MSRAVPSGKEDDCCYSTPESGQMSSAKRAGRLERDLKGNYDVRFKSLAQGRPTPRNLAVVTH